jgi:glycosyltransferase involved in cell wall biosynthesis
VTEPRVSHITPILFGGEGLFGGGERYVLELAKALAELTPTRLVGFGRESRREQIGSLTVEILRARWRRGGAAIHPVSEQLARVVARADVVHAHQYHSLTTNVSTVAARVLGRRVFITDHGGSRFSAAHRVRQDRLIDRFLPVSRFGADQFPELAARTTVIGGGVDERRFIPGSLERSRAVVFVGRLLPHKGLDVLINAVDGRTPLHLYGRTYDAAYRAELGRLAAGKIVHFHENATDEDIVRAYREARVAVLPSVYETPYGPPHPFSELLGLALLEAMACATPVVATRVGGMPEVVRDGETGTLVAPNDPDALGRAIRAYLDDDACWRDASFAAREDVEARWTWRHVAGRCLDAYASSKSR